MIVASRFGLALFVVGLTATSSRAQENDQRLCPDMAELFSNPDYQAANCMIVDFPDDCGNCNAVAGAAAAAVDFLPGGVDCKTMEENLCPSIRCCENCWEKLQNYSQCFMVEPNWMSSGGLVEDGCVLDCSRFPIGGGEPNQDSSVANEPNDSSPDGKDPVVVDTNSGIYVQDEEFITQCRAARNNMICQIENCQQCGDDGYPSVAATQLEGIKEVGSFYTCGQVEEAICPEIRCCEKECDYKLSEFWFQCNVVESAKELGRTDFSCTIDCSSYKGDNSLAAVGGPSEDVDGEEDPESGLFDAVGDVLDSMVGSPAPTATTSMLSRNIGMLVLVGALARE